MNYQKLVILACIFLTTSTASHVQTLKTANSVNLKKYSGQWYEVARYENFFQRKCKATKVRYQIIGENKIQVINMCRNKKGKLIKSTGHAIALHPPDNSKLKVCLGPTKLFCALLKYNYEIIYLDSEYQHAIVASPSSKYLWVLSRDNEVTDEQYKELINIAVEQLGFQRELIQKTPTWQDTNAGLNVLVQ